MSQMPGNAQLKEHAALIDALRHKYAEKDDAQEVAAVERVLAEASQACEASEQDAQLLISGRCLNL